MPARTPENLRSEKITVIVPAWNEEKLIGRVLNPLKSWQKQDPARREVVLIDEIDDGSKDRTREIAGRTGVKVIHSDPIKGKHLGKGQAFLAGAIHAKQNNSSILVTLDADIIRLKPIQVTRLALELKERKVNMLTALQNEGMQFYIRESSEQRAFRIQALEPLFRRKAKWIEAVKGFGLEEALNKLIREKGYSNLMFNTEKPYRKDPLKQARERFRAQAILEQRGKLARRIRDLRSEGKKAEAKFLLKRQKKKFRFFR
ncbi:MAG: glycosyltransferase [Candidatus Diapherotrites archaeon]